MYHYNDEETKRLITKQLLSYGIATNVENGKISYFEKKKIELRCNLLYLLRHAETLAIKEKCFMSDVSSNSALSEKGILNIKKIANEIEKMRFDYILYSSIPRVKETAQIIQCSIKNESCFREVHWMKGIDNAGWEGKKVMELEGTDAQDFFQREIQHDIFAKSSKGCSWGEVLTRCIKLVKYINKNYGSKKVLLISQGSILIGLQIILHMQDEIWDYYDTEAFFGLKDRKREVQDYGKLHLIYGSDENKV